MAIIGGVDYIGIYVSDLERSLVFYRDILGFTNVVQDNICEVVRPNWIVGTEKPRSHEILLRSKNEDDLGCGKIKLAQSLSPYVAGPIDSNYIWGNPGISEFSLNVENIEETLIALRNKGAEIELSRKYIVLSNKKVKYAYIRDDDSILIELIEVKKADNFGDCSRICGVNHVGIGVSDIERSLIFYRDILGFTDVMWDHTGMFKGIPPLEKPNLQLDPVNMRVVMLRNPKGGAWIELVKRFTQNEVRQFSTSGIQIGYSEIGVKVSKLEDVFYKLEKEKIKVILPKKGEEFNSLECGLIFDPDNLPIILFES